MGAGGAGGGDGGHVDRAGSGHHAVGGVCDCPSLRSWARKAMVAVPVAYSAASGDPGQSCVLVLP